VNSALCRLIDLATAHAKAGGSKESFKKHIKKEYGFELDDDANQSIYDEGVKNLIDNKYPAEHEVSKLKKQLAGVIIDSQEKTARDWFDALYRTGLLSLTRTPQASIVGNAASLAIESVSKTVATVVDIAVSAKSKQRSVSVAGMSQAKVTLSKEAAQKTWQVLKQGMTDEELEYGLDSKAAYEAQQFKGNNPVSKLVAGWINFKFNSIGAADRPTREAAFKTALYEHATLQAMNEGLKGDDVGKRVTELLGDNPSLGTVVSAAISEFDSSANPIGEILMKAQEDTDIMLLQNATTLNRAVSGLTRAIPVGGTLILPFPRIPTNVSVRAIEYSPLGFIWGVGKTIQSTKMEAPGAKVAAQRQGTMAIGRSVTGAGLLALGYFLKQHGSVSEPAEVDRSQRGAQDAAGIQPGSFKIPGTNLQFKISDYPQLAPLIWGAAIARDEELAKTEGKSYGATDAVFSEGKGMAKAVLDAPVLTGTKSVVTDLTNVGKKDAEGNYSPSQILNSLGGAIVPTDLTDLIRIVKGQKGYTTADNPLDRLKSDAGIDGPPARDALGREKLSGNPLIRGLSRDLSSKQKDPVAKELYRLGIGLTPLNRKKEDGETNEQLSSRQKFYGELMREQVGTLVTNSEYLKLGDSDKRKLMELFLAKVKPKISKAATILSQQENDNGK
jgi:hypothetical protein